MVAVFIMANKILIEGKVALVSGANRGIGKAIVVELLENGAKKVYAGARKVDSLNELKEKYPEKLVPIELDVTNDDTITKVKETAADIDILINNAGIFEFGNFLKGNLEESLKKNLDVNLWGLIKLTNAMLPILKDKDSAAIACVGSMVSFSSMPMGLTYSASKAAMHSVVQGLRGELKDSNILISGIYPGPIDTDMTKGFDMEKDSPETVAKNVVQGLKDGKEYIFPDKMSSQMGELYLKDPKKLEEEFSKWA